MDNILENIKNMVRETEFEDEFVSMKVGKDKHGRLVFETETVNPVAPFMVRVGKPDTTRRRFSTNLRNEVEVEVWDEDDRKWIPEIGTVSVGV